MLRCCWFGINLYLLINLMRFFFIYFASGYGHLVFYLNFHETCFIDGTTEIMQTWNKTDLYRLKIVMNFLKVVVTDFNANDCKSFVIDLSFDISVQNKGQMGIAYSMKNYSNQYTQLYKAMIIPLRWLNERGNNHHPFLENGMLLICTNLNSLRQRMLWSKLGWNWPCGSGDNFFLISTLYLRYFVIIFPF